MNGQIKVHLPALLSVCTEIQAIAWIYFLFCKCYYIKVMCVCMCIFCFSKTSKKPLSFLAAIQMYVVTYEYVCVCQCVRVRQCVCVFFFFPWRQTDPFLHSVFKMYKGHATWIFIIIKWKYIASLLNKLWILK